MPKVLIDMPEQYLKLIHSDSPINLVSMSGFLNFVRNGIALDGLTNGEVMRKIFNMSLDDFQHTWGGGDYTNEWWNRKWGE